MFVLRSALLWLASGTLLVPTHFCCAFESAPKPCCQEVQKAVAPPTHARPCCQSRQGRDDGLRAVAPAESPVAKCCCRAADPVVTPLASVMPHDMLRALPGDAQPDVSQIYGVDNSVERLLLPPEDLQTRLCRLRC